MGNSIANLAVKLSLDGAGFESGVKVAESSTRRWGGSIDQIIEKMERQSQGVEESSRRAAIFAAAQKGASSQTVAYALSLDAEIEAMERLAAAEERERQAQERAKETERRRIASIDQLVGSLQREVETYGMSSRQLQIYELRQLGASEKTIQHAIALQMKIRELRQADTLTKHLSDSTSRLAMSSRGAQESLMGSSAAMNKSVLVTQSLIYGVEDAATVYGDQGLRGALRASMNNFVMAGMIMSPQIGLMLALASTVLQLGMAFTKSSEGTDKEARSLEDLNKRLDENASKYDQMISRRNQLDRLSSSEDASNAFAETGQEIWKNQRLKQDAMADKERLVAPFRMSDGTMIGIGDPETIKRIEEADEAIRKYDETIGELTKHQENLRAAHGRLKAEEKTQAEMELAITSGELRLEQQNREIQRLKELGDQYEKLAQGPLNKYNEKLMELTEVYDAGEITEAQFRKNLRLLDQEFLKPSDAAQKYIDNAMTPMEKYEKELNKLQEELAKGDISESVYDANAKLLQDQIFKDDKLITNSAGGAAAAGSKEAYSAIASVITADQSKDGMANLNRTAAQQLTEAKKQTTALDEVRKKLEPVEEADLG